MNKRLWLLLPLVLILSVGGACTDKLEITDVNKVQEGIPVKITLSLGVGESVAITRSAESAETENKVNDVFLFAFMLLIASSIATFWGSTASFSEAIASFSMDFP